MHDRVGSALGQNDSSITRVVPGNSRTTSGCRPKASGGFAAKTQSSKVPVQIEGTFHELPGSQRRQDAVQAIGLGEQEHAKVCNCSSFISIAMLRIMIDRSCPFRLKPRWNHALRSDSNPIGQRWPLPEFKNTGI